MRQTTVQALVNLKVARFWRVLALVSALGISACSSSTPTGPSSGAPVPPFVQATLDGAKWTSERVTIDEEPAQLPRPGFLIIAGTGSFGRDGVANVILHISPPPTSVGTYTTDDSDFRLTVAIHQEAGQFRTFHASNAHLGTMGTLTLNALTTAVAAGTFSFTGVSNDNQTKTVSNGSFDVTF